MTDAKCDGPVLPFEPDTGFLELEVIAGFRVWQLAFMGAFGILCIVIVACCFMRCRIPRTKQEIEADVARKKVTKQFSKHLQKISIESMELEKVLPEVMTLEHQRILKGIKEEKMSLWQKVKKMLCSGSAEEDDDDGDADADNEHLDEEGADEEVKVSRDDDAADDDEGDEEEADDDKAAAEPTDGEDSCVITVVEGSSSKEGKGSKRTSKTWRRIVNVTTSSQAIARSQRSKLKKSSTDSPKTMSHRLQEVKIDKASKKSDHKLTRGESSKKMLAKTSSIKPSSGDHDDAHEEITRL